MGKNSALAFSSEHTATETAPATWPTFQQSCNDAAPADHFITRNGKTFAGTHLIFDFWEATRLDDLALMEQSLRAAVKAAGDSLLHIHLHHFTSNGVISGVAVLAESHISVHTWPERGFAAFDVFMCGEAQPERAVPVLKAAFSPNHITITEHLRGVTNDE